MSEDEARWTGYIPKGGVLEDVFEWDSGILRDGYNAVAEYRLPEDKWDHDAGDWPPDKVEVIVRRVNK